MKLFVIAALVVCALAAQDIHSGYFRGQLVHYKVIDGIAITEGDIVLNLDDNAKTGDRDAIGKSGGNFRWTDGIIAYTIDSNLPNPQRVLDAIEHWNTKTPIRIIPRTD